MAIIIQEFLLSIVDDAIGNHNGGKPRSYELFVFHRHCRDNGNCIFLSRRHCHKYQRFRLFNRHVKVSKAIRNNIDLRSIQFYS